jgi:hypothetical protein
MMAFCGRMDCKLNLFLGRPTMNNASAPCLNIHIKSVSAYSDSERSLQERSESSTPARSPTVNNPSVLDMMPDRPQQLQQPSAFSIRAKQIIPTQKEMTSIFSQVLCGFIIGSGSCGMLNHVCFSMGAIKICPPKDASAKWFVFGVGLVAAVIGVAAAILAENKIKVDARPEDVEAKARQLYLCRIKEALLEANHSVNKILGELRGFEKELPSADLKDCSIIIDEANKYYESVHGAEELEKIKYGLLEHINNIISACSNNTLPSANTPIRVKQVQDEVMRIIDTLKVEVKHLIEDEKYVTSGVNMNDLNMAEAALQARYSCIYPSHYIFNMSVGLFSGAACVMNTSDSDLIKKIGLIVQGISASTGMCWPTTLPHYSRIQDEDNIELNEVVIHSANT